jgi:hypothetical protein
LFWDRVSLCCPGWANKPSNLWMLDASKFSTQIFKIIISFDYLFPLSICSEFFFFFLWFGAWIQGFHPSHSTSLFFF